MKLYYLLINLGALSIPLLFSFHPSIRFYREWKAWLLSLLMIASVFIAWDVLFTHLGVWHFNPEFVMGIYLFGLPLEEWLFFFCIPYACLFTWYCLTGLYSEYTEKGSVKTAALLPGLLLIITGLFHLNKLYTSVTFLITGLFLLIAAAGKYFPWVQRSLVVYAMLLLPFFIVNGLLTGMATSEPVVGYDNNENLGIRLLTIPLEDAVYGYLLFALNLIIFESLRKYRQVKLPEQGWKNWLMFR